MAIRKNIEGEVVVAEPPETLDELVVRAQRGDRGAEREVLRRFNSVIHKYAIKYWAHNSVLTVEDFVGWGRLSLLISIQRFDSSLRYFTPYALNGMRRFMYYAHQLHGCTVRVPVTSGNTQAISSEEYSAARATIPWTEVEEEVGAFDASIENAENVEDVRYWVGRALRAAVLTSREREAVDLLFGFVDGRSHTLKGVAAEMHISITRVQQLRTSALIRIGNVLERWEQSAIGDRKVSPKLRATHDAIVSAHHAYDLRGSKRTGRHLHIKRRKKGTKRWHQ